MVVTPVMTMSTALRDDRHTALNTDRISYLNLLAAQAAGRSLRYVIPSAEKKSAGVSVGATSGSAAKKSAVIFVISKSAGCREYMPGYHDIAEKYVVR